MEETDKLQKRLEARQYPETVVEAARLRASAIPRSRALEKVERRETNGERQHRLVCRYDRRSGPALRGVMEDGYEAATTRDVRFRRWFPNKPKPAFRRGRTLREELVKARLPSGRVTRPRHCSQVGPHLGTRVLMGTFFSLWVPKRSPFSFKVPIFSISG